MKTQRKQQLNLETKEMVKFGNQNSHVSQADQGRTTNDQMTVTITTVTSYPCNGNYFKYNVVL